MSKIYYNSVKLSECSKTLDIAIQGFDKTISAFGGLDVPDFDHAGTLKNLPGELEECKSSCVSDQEWIDLNKSKIDEELSLSTRNISNVDVQTSLVKDLNVK